MNLIYVMATTLRNLVLKKHSKNTSTASAVESPQVTTSFEKEIIIKLCKYIDRTITPKEFADWFVPSTWHMYKQEPSYCSNLVYSIKLRFAEYSNGHWTAEELRERLIDLIL